MNEVLAWARGQSGGSCRRQARSALWLLSEGSGALLAVQLSLFASASVHHLHSASTEIYTHASKRSILFEHTAVLKQHELVCSGSLTPQLSQKGIGMSAVPAYNRDSGQAGVVMARTLQIFE